MSDSGELSDWELLPNSPNSPTPFEKFDPESDAIKLDYFALDSGDRIRKRAVSDEEDWLSESTVEDSIDSGEKGGIFPEEEKTCELGLAESGRMGDCVEEAKLEVGFDEVTVSKGGAIGETEEFDGNGVFGGEVTELGLAEPVRVEDRCAEEPRLDVGFDAVQRRAAIEEIGEAEGMEDVGELAVDAEQRRAAIEEIEEAEGMEDVGELAVDAEQRRAAIEEIGEAERMEDVGELAVDAEQRRAAIEEIGEAERMEDVGELAVGAGQGERTKGVSVWLKMPLELLKMCVLKVRPVWSISIAAGIIGMLMLGRRLYKMKGKNRGIPLRISLDDKKASHLVVRAGRLSESFSAVRRVPFVRLPPPAGSVSLWPVAGSLRALDW